MSPILSAECITASTAIESAIKKLEQDLYALKKLAKKQYDLEWENFEKPASEKVTLDIFKRLDLWCRINEVVDWQLNTGIAGLLAHKPLIKETEKALAKQVENVWDKGALKV